MDENSTRVAFLRNKILIKNLTFLLKYLNINNTIQVQREKTIKPTQSIFKIFSIVILLKSSGLISNATSNEWYKQFPSPADVSLNRWKNKMLGDILNKEMEGQEQQME